uniref:Uncharacterized protein n=1 Tax=Romanomermis culicivorax TaxID=13658 RepID=A0A915KTW2_ROMCU
MSVNNLINQYLERRGFLDHQPKNVLNVVENEDQLESTRQFLESYLKFLKFVDKNLASITANLNYQIFKYLNAISSNTELITDTFFDQPIFIDDGFFFKNRHSSHFELFHHEISKFLSENPIQNPVIQNIFDTFLCHLNHNSVFSMQENHKFIDQNFTEVEKSNQQNLLLDSFLQIDENQFLTNDNRISQSILTYKFKNRDHFSTAAISRDRKLIALGGDDGFLSIYNENCADRLNFEGHSGSIFDAKFLQDDEKDLLLTCSQDHSIKLWDISYRRSYDQKHFQYTGHSSPIFCLDVDGQGQFFASGGSTDRKICIYDVQNVNPLRSLCYHSQSVQCLRFADTLFPGQKSLLVTTSSDRKICVWSPNTSCPIRIYHFLNHYPTMLAYHPTKNYLIVGSFDRKLTIFDVRRDHVIQTLDLDHIIPYCLDFDRSKQGHWALFHVGGVSVCPGFHTVKRLRMTFDNGDGNSSKLKYHDTMDEGKKSEKQEKVIKSGLDFDSELKENFRCQALAARDTDYPYTVAILTT